MTILNFQEELAKDVEHILKDVVTTNAAGERIHGVTVYKQRTAGNQLRMKKMNLNFFHMQL